MLKSDSSQRYVQPARPVSLGNTSQHRGSTLCLSVTRQEICKTWQIQLKWGNNELRKVFGFWSVKSQDDTSSVSVCLALLESVSPLHLFSLSLALLFTLSLCHPLCSSSPSPSHTHTHTRCFIMSPLECVLCSMLCFPAVCRENCRWTFEMSLETKTWFRRVPLQMDQFEEKKTSEMSENTLPLKERSL